MDKDLAEVFNFTEADLEANHKGYLSEKQLSEFRADTKETLAVYKVVLLLLPLPILLFNLAYCNVIFALMEVAAIFLYQKISKQARFTLKAGDLQVVEGQIKFGGRRRYLYIGDKRFLVNRKQFETVWENQRHRFYSSQKPLPLVVVGEKG